MSDIIASVMEASALLRAYPEPKPIHIWSTRAIVEHRHAARVDLPDRILFFISPGAVLAFRRDTPVRDGPLTLCGYTLRDFDRLPRDARLTLAMEVDEVSPGMAARLALV